MTAMEVDAPMMSICPREDGEARVADRFVPSRETCNAVSQSRLKDPDENWAPTNHYQEVLSQGMLGEDLSDVKVLTYKHKPSLQPANELQVLCSSNSERVVRRPKPSRVVSQTPLRVLDAPGLVDDFYTHPLDWSSRNVVAVALSDMAYLFDATSQRADKLTSMADASFESVRFTGEGFHLSLGTSSGEVQIWDCEAQKQLRKMPGHGGAVFSQAWNEHVVSTGSADLEIHHHDVRVRDHLVGKLVGAHTGLVCGLEYSNDGLLASGGNDNVVCIWDARSGDSSPLRSLREHRAAVKALKFCPWQRHVLATGGGSADRRLCLWNASTGRLMMERDAESQVTGIAWGSQEKELVTSHGYSRNQISLWKYPSLSKIVDLEGHTGRCLEIAQSPDGAVICSAAADETLRFWKVFAAEKKAGKGDARDDPMTGMNQHLRTIR